MKNMFDFNEYDSLESPETSPPSKRSSSFSPPQGVKRKFPGPAGLLLDDLKNLLPQDIPCSQSSVSVFQENPWLKMLKDYGQYAEKFTIKWIKEKTFKKQLNNQKAPFLAGVIHSVQCYDSKVSMVYVILRDLTGQIRGTIKNNLYEKYCKELVAGSIVVLKEFSVLNGSDLIITEKNLIAIYSKNCGDDDDDIKKTEIIQDFKINIESPTKNDTVYNIKSVVNEEKNTAKMEKVKASNEELIKAALEGVDVDALFDDF